MKLPNQLLQLGGSANVNVAVPEEANSENGNNGHTYEKHCPVRDDDCATGCTEC